jgi:hypothetical protein
MTQEGKRELTGLVGNIGSYKTAFGWMALDSSATAFVKTQTALVSEIANTNGLGRAAATVTQQTTTDTSDTLQFYKSWTCTGGTTGVNAVGVFNASSSGTMGSRDVLAATRTLTSGMTITETVKWVFA